MLRVTGFLGVALREPSGAVGCGITQLGLSIGVRVGIARMVSLSPVTHALQKAGWPCTTLRTQDDIGFFMSFHNVYIERSSILFLGSVRGFPGSKSVAWPPRFGPPGFGPPGFGPPEFEDFRVPNPWLGPRGLAPPGGPNPGGQATDLEPGNPQTPGGQTPGGQTPGGQTSEAMPRIWTLEILSPTLETI